MTRTICKICLGDLTTGEDMATGVRYWRHTEAGDQAVCDGGHPQELKGDKARVSYEDLRRASRAVNLLWALMEIEGIAGWEEEDVNLVVEARAELRHYATSLMGDIRHDTDQHTES